MSNPQGGEVSTLATITEQCADAGALPRLLTHIQNPQHLLGYMIFSAWCKYMAVLSWIPSITIGG